MPIWAYAYMTRPEQSKPEGLAPPQEYGTPRERIALSTTPPYCDGGATVPSGVEPPTPNGLAWIARFVACCAVLYCARAADADASARARATACRCAISPLIDESRRCWRESCDDRLAFASARWRTSTIC